MKTIFTDLDGTLLDENDQLPKRVQEAIAAVRAVGHRVIPISGSPYPWVSGLLKECQLDYIISSNGARCYDEVNKKVIWSDLIEPEILATLITKFGDHFTEVLIHQGDTRFFIEPDKIQPHMLENVNQIVPILKVNELPKGMDAFFKKHKIYSPYNTLGRENLGSHGAYMDIVPTYITKTYAVEHMCKMYNIDKADTVAMGDGMNDFSLFDACHTRVAVGNAIPELKACADIIVGTNDEGGIADYLLTLV